VIIHAGTHDSLKKQTNKKNMILYLLSRARAAMPFGCLTLGEKKDYNSPSEVTDKYDLGQVVKS